MFRKIKQLFGGKSDEELMAEPRRVPPQFKDAQDGDDRWIMTREFALKSDPRKRLYISATRERGEDKWYIHENWTDLGENDRDMTRRLTEFATTPYDAVLTLSEWEKMMRDEKSAYIPVPSAYPTYIPFANRHGMHFSDEGKLLLVDAAKPLSKGTIMPRATLEKIYNPVAIGTAGLGTWNGFYERVVNKFPDESVSPADLVADPAFPRYRAEGEKMVEKLKKLPDDLMSDKFTTFEKESALRDMQNFVMVNPLVFATSAKAKAAQHICDTSLVIGLLRSGAKIYSAMFEEGARPAPDKLRLVRKIGEAVQFLCRERLKLPENDAEKVAGIIGEGPDPYIHTLPLEAILKQADQPKPQGPEI